MKPSEARKLAKQRIAEWRALSLQELKEIDERFELEEKNQKPAFRYHSWDNRWLFKRHLKKSLDAYFALNPEATEWRGNFAELFKLLSTLEMPTDGLYRFAVELPVAKDFYPCSITDETWTFTKNI